LRDGRAIPHDTAAGTDPRPRDRHLRLAGSTSALLGLVLTLVAAWNHAPTASFRLVPEAVVGFQAIALGAVAIVLGRPYPERGYGRATAPVFIAAMILATIGTVIVALDGLRLVDIDPHGPARPIVFIGLFITECAVVFAVLWIPITRLAAALERLPSLASRRR
jgi:hypothetical protein